MEHPDSILSALDRAEPAVTMFGPNDEAFEALPDHLKTKLLPAVIHANHMALLQDMLKFHVFSNPTMTPSDND